MAPGTDRSSSAEPRQPHMRAGRSQKRTQARRRTSRLTIAVLTGVPIALLVAGAALAIASTPSSPAIRKDPQEFQPRPAYAPGVRPAVHAPRAIPTLPVPVSAPPQGVIQSGQAPFPASEYAFVNQWQAKVGNQWVQVYAGTVADDPSQGVVVIRRSAPD